MDATYAAELVMASMENDTVKAEKINRRLYENADEVSTLLDSINPYWHYNEWKSMFYMHLDLAKKFATEMINGYYKDSIQTYDRFEAEIMLMADMMAEGIINQFYAK